MHHYPDHVSVIFEGSQNAPVEVREFQDYVEVSFSDYLVQPDQIMISPDPRLVTWVDFNEQESYGSFRIQKGSQFSSFRQHYLESTAKLIIEVFGARSSSVSESLPATRPAPDRANSAPPLPARTGANDVVVIDAGHGGVDYGVDAHQDLLEKVITMNVARRIEGELSRRGLKVRLTRVRDVQLLNEQRSAVSNFYHCRLYVGVHLGGAPDKSTRGPVVYVYDPPESSDSASRGPGATGQELIPWDKGQSKFLSSSRRLATTTQAELNELFETNNPIVEARLAVLASVKAPAVLVETGYLTNLEDQALLATPGFQERIAESIARAITRFLR
jgi:N-acetylmuramoyl-L-alanine amidase